MFRFQLEPLLNYRKMIEERITLEFSDRLRNLEEQKALLASLEGQEAELLAKFKDMQGGAFHAVDARLFASYFDHLKERRRAQQEAVSRAGEETEAKRNELSEAMKKRKAIEILKERKFAEYREDRMRKEFKELDELGITGHGKKSVTEKMDSGV